MSRPRINLMVMREGEVGQAVRSYSLPGYVPRLGILLSVIVALIVIMAVSGVVYFWRTAREAQSLRAENESLRRSVAHLGQLEGELEQHRQFTRRVAEMVGIDIPSFNDSSFGRDVAALKESPLGSDSLDMPSPLAQASPEAAPAVVGILVVNCGADPNNRPRGVPVVGRLSRGFQPEAANPALRHHGIDIAVREGSPIFAPAAGTVVYAGPDDIFGLMLVLDHGDGFKSIYGHNSELLAKMGEEIERADVIALSGNTGVSTAPHLHYEIHKDDKPVDPAGFLGR